MKESANEAIRQKLEEMERSPKVCKFTLSMNSKTAFFGAWVSGELDIDDLQKLPENAEFPFQTAMFLHEVFEQWEKQANQQAEFQTAHKEADKVVGQLTKLYKVRDMLRNLMIAGSGTVGGAIEYRQEMITTEKDVWGTRVERTFYRTVLLHTIQKSDTLELIETSITTEPWIQKK